MEQTNEYLGEARLPGVKPLPMEGRKNKHVTLGKTSLACGYLVKEFGVTT